MKRVIHWFRVVYLALILSSAVLAPTVAIAQNTLPQSAPDAGGGFNSAGPSDIANDYYNATNQWINAIKPVANSLFWALAGIDITWTCITLVLQHTELYPWMAGFIRKILTIGFFAVLLQNGTTWIADIVNFFINLGATAGGRTVSGLSASAIMGDGIQIAGKMLNGAAGAAATGASTNPIGLLVSGVGSLAPTIILSLAALFIVVAYVIIALHFVIAIVEAYVVVGAGYIFLGFGGSRWTVPYTEKYIGMVVSAGVRIMVLEMMIGLGSTLYQSWVATANKIASVPDILDGGTVSGSWTGVQLLFALVSSIAIYGLLCWTIPQIAANVVAGGLSMSGGDALSASAAAGTAAFAGVQMASGSNQGSQHDVAQVAQAAAMKGAEMGVQLAMAAASGGGTASVSAVAETANAASSAGSGLKDVVDGITPPPPADSSSGIGPTEGTVPPPGSGAGESSGDASGNEGGGTAGPDISVAEGTTTPSVGQGDDSGGSSPGAGEGNRADTEEAARVAGDIATETTAQAETAARGAEGDAAEAKRVATDTATEVAAGSGSISSNPETPAGGTPAVTGSGSDEKAGGGKGETIRTLLSGAQEAERALNKMPDDGGQISGTTPEINHGE